MVGGHASRCDLVWNYVVWPVQWQYSTAAECRELSIFRASTAMKRVSLPHRWNMNKPGYEPSPMTFAPPGEGWGQLAAQYPQNGDSGMLGADARVVPESWRRRFGAYVYSASDSRLSPTVTRPPTDIVQARLVAREHFHFCRCDSQFHGLGGIGAVVAELISSTFWSFWWD
ncbi:DUF4253 domain-containing protein [Subtercola vilae]|uniref:DUF4253 domain-containing protein n=3 Tax=Subtercola TaxID=120212 RepID=A0A4V4RDL5_9MICO|nr:DUF4253 domain-containing protein [Subtercola vilae]